jgi:iron complex outermembrane receptor protein
MVLVDPNDTSAVPSEATCRTNQNNVFADAKFKKLTYTLGANWQITPDAMIYVAHRRGYRAGGYNTPKLDPYLAGAQTFRPETLTDWEAGLKLRLRAGDVRGTLDLAVYTGKDTDNQLPANTSGASGGKCIVDALGTPGHPGTVGVGGDACFSTRAQGSAPAGSAGSLVRVASSTNIVNGADLTIRGFEAAGTLSPFPGLTFNGSLSYTQVKVNSVTLPPLSPIGLFLTENGLPIIPANVVIQGQPTWTSNAGVTVDYPSEILGGNLSASLDYHYNGSYRSSSIDVPSWHQIDIRVNLADIGKTGVSAAVYVKNLTNEFAYQGTGASSPASFGTQSFILGKSRTVGMRVAYKFGGAR